VSWFRVFLWMVRVSVLVVVVSICGLLVNESNVCLFCLMYRVSLLSCRMMSVLVLRFGLCLVMGLLLVRLVCLG